MSLFPENLSTLDLRGNRLKSFSLVPNTEETDYTCYSVVNSFGNITLPYGKQSNKTRTRFCVHRKHQRLNHVVQLNLSDNELTSLSVTYTPPNDQVQKKAYCLFPELKSLDLSFNRQLKTLPEGLGKLQKLGSLSLNNTALDTLPSELGLCCELYELKIEGLHLRNPPKNVLEKRLLDGRRDVKSITGYLRSLHDK